MKILIINFVAVILFFVVINPVNCQNNFPVLNGSYLGQNPPGKIPKIFAPGIISTDVNEGCVSFTKDYNIFLFARSGIGIMQMQQVNGKWNAPELAEFSAGECDWDFMLAPDDKTVFVSSGRADKEGGDTLDDYRIWISERIGFNWSDPVLLPAPINTGQHDSYPSITKDGTLYFFSNRENGFGYGDIYRAKKIGDKYPYIENLGKPVNTLFHEVDPYIDPNEEYLIFCSDKPGGYGDSDFFISFRTKEDKWLEPVNMGKTINSIAADYIPYITPDGTYFFFTSNKTGNREIYWVDAKIIDQYKTQIQNDK